jgi:hypothetical protein
MWRGPSVSFPASGDQWGGAGHRNRHAAARPAAAIDPGAVMTYVRNNPGNSGEQVAQEMGTAHAAAGVAGG